MAKRVSRTATLARPEFSLYLSSMFLKNLNEYIGRAVSWLTFILVILVVYDVLMRYLFNSTAVWIGELEWHLFALLFLLGAGYALKHDRHVRVDLFYGNFSKRDRAWVDLIGHTFLLLPWCIVLIWVSSRYAYDSFQIGEGSPDPGGLPFRFLVKSAIPLCFVLLLLQGVLQILERIKLLRNPSENRHG